jgi:hypothetical protein
MLHRRLGRTELQVSVVGFGGLPLARVGAPEAVRVIHRALDLGINFFDTARLYSTSEEKIGAALRGRRSGAIVATKSLVRSAEGMRREIERSLRALGTDYIDLYQVHDLTRLAEWERIKGAGGALEALAAARERGLIRHVGVTGHSHGTLVEAAASGLFETVLFPFSILEREFLHALGPTCRRLDLGTIAMKPLCGGALTRPVAALGYVLAHQVSTVIPGMESIAQVEENAVAGAEGSQAQDEAALSALKTEADRLGKEFCRRCGYCQPCPAGVNVPEILRLERYYTWHSLPEMARSQYALLGTDAGACLTCGLCEERCPYGLPIRSMLARAHALLSRPRGLDSEDPTPPGAPEYHAERQG